MRRATTVANLATPSLAIECPRNPGPWPQKKRSASSTRRPKTARGEDALQTLTAPAAVVDYRPILSLTDAKYDAHASRKHQPRNRHENQATRGRLARQPGTAPDVILVWGAMTAAL